MSYAIYTIYFCKIQHKLEISRYQTFRSAEDRGVVRNRKKPLELPIDIAATINTVALSDSYRNEISTYALEHVLVLISDVGRRSWSSINTDYLEWGWLSPARD